MYRNFAYEKGFTLLESLVALVILSLVFSGLWGWFGTAAQSTTRIEEAMMLPKVYEQYLDHMALESLKEKRTGELEIDKFNINWSVTPNRVSNREIYRRQRERIVTLFDVDIRIMRQQRLVAEVSTQLVRQWHDPSYVQSPDFF